jgi:hypothetical protein
MTVKLGARFTARFESECANCGDTITEGTSARYVDDEVVCWFCGDEAEREHEQDDDEDFTS